MGSWPPASHRQGCFAGRGRTDHAENSYDPRVEAHHGHRYQRIELLDYIAKLAEPAAWNKNDLARLECNSSDLTGSIASLNVSTREVPVAGSTIWMCGLLPAFSVGRRPRRARWPAWSSASMEPRPDGAPRPAPKQTAPRSSAHKPRRRGAAAGRPAYCRIPSVLQLHPHHLVAAAIDGAALGNLNGARLACGPGLHPLRVSASSSVGVPSKVTSPRHDRPRPEAARGWLCTW